MTPIFDNFVVSRLHQRVTWAKKCKKKWFPPKLQFFYWFGVVEISLTKRQNMAILRLSWRGQNNRKKYFLQLICVKKDCFYPIQVLGKHFLHFWSISQRSKFWWKFPLKTWVFRYGPLFIFSLGVPDETKSCFLQME